MNVKKFLGLDKRKLVLFCLFSIVLYFGSVQAWVFCKECGPKPLFYDEISAFPFWSLWAYLSLPILIISTHLFQGAFLVLFNLAYFYVISCFMIYSFERFRKEFSRRVIGFWAILFIALNLYNLVALSLLVSASKEQIIASATQSNFLEALGFFLTELIAFTFYAFIISGIFFVAKNKLCKSKPEKMFSVKQLSIVLLTVLAATSLFLSGCLEKTCFDNKNCPLSDEAYIQIAKTTPEAQAFLQKYPVATVSVERTEYLAVDFRIEKLNNFITTENNPIPPYLRLRVFVDTSINKPKSSFIECRPSAENYLRIDQNPVEYLKTEKCLT